MSLKYYFRFLGPVSVFAVRHKYAGIFLSMFLGVLAVPLPLEGMLVYIGYRVYRGKLSMMLVLLSIILGGVSATVLSYMFMRTIGIAIVKKYAGRFYPNNEEKKYITSSFERVGKWGLLVGYFLPVVRHLLGPLAAVFKLDFFEFITLSFLGCTIWSMTFFLIGCTAGKDWDQFSPQVQYFLIFMSVTAIIFGFFYFLITSRKLKSNNSKVKRS